MDQDYKKRVKSSFNEALKALFASIKSAHQLAPAAVIVIALLSIVIVGITTISSTLMTATAVLLVIAVSISIFIVKENFGEGMISLVGGLLTIFAFKFTVEKYIAFTAAWLTYAFFALLISSLKIAAKVEEIYREAAIRHAKIGEKIDEIEKELQEIAQNEELKYLGPIEKAGVIRICTFRNINTSVIPEVLHAVSIFSIITKVNERTLANFVCDAFTAFKVKTRNDGKNLTDILLYSVQNSAVPASEYFDAFQNSRRALLNQDIEPETYFGHLSSFLEVGTPATEMYQAIKSTINTSTASI